jgi:hypothetical protein
MVGCAERRLFEPSDQERVVDAIGGTVEHLLCRAAGEIKSRPSHEQHTVAAARRGAGPTTPHAHRGEWWGPAPPPHAHRTLPQAAHRTQRATHRTHS